MKKILLILFIFFPFISAAYVLKHDTIPSIPYDVNPKGKKKNLKDRPTIIPIKEADSSSFKISLQLYGGSQGLGGDLRLGLIRKLSLRLGSAYTPFNYVGSIHSSGLATNFTINANFLNFHAWADFAPFNNAEGLRLVGGMAYTYRGLLNTNFAPTGNYTLGGYTLTAEEIGQLNIGVTLKGFAPYMGLGFAKSFPKHFFNINLDLGAYYVNAPTAKITGTNLLSDNYQLEPKVNDNLKDYRWVPVLQLNFNFRIK